MGPAQVGGSPAAAQGQCLSFRPIYSRRFLTWCDFIQTKHVCHNKLATSKPARNTKQAATLPPLPQSRGSTHVKLFGQHCRDEIGRKLGVITSLVLPWQFGEELHGMTGGFLHRGSANTYFMTTITTMTTAGPSAAAAAAAATTITRLRLGTTHLRIPRTTESCLCISLSSGGSSPRASWQHTLTCSISVSPAGPSWTWF